MITISWMTIITIVFIILALVLFVSGSREAGMMGGFTQFILLCLLAAIYAGLWIGKLLL